MVRAEILLSGAVQGVGCRFATQAAARRLGLVGTVENLVDGRVKIVVEGSEAIVKQLPDEIDGGGFIRIKDVHWNFSAATGQFLSFDIVR